MKIFFLFIINRLYAVKSPLITRGSSCRITVGCAPRRCRLHKLLDMGRCLNPQGRDAEAACGIVIRRTKGFSGKRPTGKVRTVELPADIQKKIYVEEKIRRCTSFPPSIGWLYPSGSVGLRYSLLSLPRFCSGRRGGTRRERSWVRSSRCTSGTAWYWLVSPFWLGYFPVRRSTGRVNGSGRA